MAKRKKKEIPLSQLLKKYTIINDMSDKYVDNNIENEKSFGGDVGAGTAGVAKGIAGSLLPGPLGGMATKGIDQIYGALDKNITPEERAIEGYAQAAGAAGTAIATGGATLPNSIAVGAQGLGQGLSNTDTGNNKLNRDLQLSGSLVNTGGQIGGMMYNNNIDTKLNSQYANGGDLNAEPGKNEGLTQYNGGGTHEQNPNGGIDVGNDTQVEDKETRWQDYIFSDRIKIPGKKYTFAEASKKINNKYNKRTNDAYDKKALDREMNGLKELQENERENMKQRHQQEYQKAFGGPTNPGVNDTIPNNNDSIPPPTSFGTSGSGTIITKYTVPTINPNSYTQGEVSSDLKKHSYLQDVVNMRVSKYLQPTKGFDANKKPTVTHPGVIIPNDISRKRLQLQRANDIFTKQTNARIKRDYPSYVDKNGILKKDKSLTPEQLAKLWSNNPQKLEAYYRAAEWQQAFEQKLNTSNPELYGTIEGANTPFRQQRYGYRHAGYKWYKGEGPDQYLTSKIAKKAYGGDIESSNEDRYELQEEPSDKIQAGFGLDMTNINGVNSAMNQNTSALTNPDSYRFDYNNPIYNYSNQYGSDGNNYQTQTDYNNNTNQLLPGQGVMTVNAFNNQNNQNGDTNSNTSSDNGDNQNKFTTQDGLILAAQNAGNIYNLAQGLKKPTVTNLGRMNPRYVNYSQALDSTNRMFDEASNTARENIRRNATSSGQALSNLIAQNTALSVRKNEALNKIKEQEQNANAGINNNSQRVNLNQLSREEQLNQLNLAAKQNATQAGLQGIGQSIAGYNKDRNMTAMQDQTIQNWMKTKGYSVVSDGQGGYHMVDINGNPVN